MRNQSKRWNTDSALWEKLKPIAREMRGKPTEAENLLWQRLRRHQLHGLSFRRQHSIGQFVVDFYCGKARLVIEIDGPIHQYQGEEDLIRQNFLESLNLKVLRFSNDYVLNNMNEVIKQIVSLFVSSLSLLAERGSGREVWIPVHVWNDFVKKEEPPGESLRRDGPSTLTMFLLYSAGSSGA
jgi:very-short-patch-repair endonuclease